MSTTADRKLVVLAPEPESRAALSDVNGVHLLADVNTKRLNKVKHLFVEVSASLLPGVSEILKAANERKDLQAVFIRADIDPKLFPQILQRADLRSMRNMLVHDCDDWLTPKRVMNAWRMGSENDLIATAAVFGHGLCILTCGFERLELSFDQIPALRSIRSKDRPQFEVDEAGSFLHWPKSDIHVDIDDIRYVIDPEWRSRCDLDRLVHDKNFGSAIASLRRKFELRQCDIPDLTDRQLRRIESGDSRPSVASLRSLAQAHDLELNEYLAQIGKDLYRVTQSRKTY